LRIADRLVGGEVPGIHHKSPADIGLALHTAWMMGLGLPSAPTAGMKVPMARRPSVSRHWCYAKHIAGCVHALEDRASGANQLLHVIHDRRGLVEGVVLADACAPICRAGRVRVWLALVNWSIAGQVSSAPVA
jgi:hypothetical protein